jgi:hypothetical protein
MTLTHPSGPATRSSDLAVAPIFTLESGWPSRRVRRATQVIGLDEPKDRPLDLLKHDAGDGTLDSCP